MTLVINSSSRNTTQDIIINGTSSIFMAEVIEKTHTFLVWVDFWASWCGPCLKLMPLLEKAIFEIKKQSLSCEG